jgi:hypothetical protein
MYVWVIEGTPHYHLIIWLREGVKLAKPDSHGWWSIGATSIERTAVDGSIGRPGWGGRAPRNGGREACAGVQYLR